jgi:hypothetical protein
MDEGFKIEDPVERKKPAEYNYKREYHYMINDY